MTHEVLRYCPSETESGTKTYGQTVREGRQLIRISQTDLARGAEISQGYLSQIEKDEVISPSFAVITRIARVLGFEIDDKETTKTGNAIYLEPRAAYLQTIMSELPPAQQELVTAYIKLTFPQDDLEKVTYLSTTQPLSGQELGKKIREERKGHGWAQGRLANEASLTQGYISQLENGLVESPSLAVLNRIAEGLEMGVKDLTGMTDMEVPEEIASVCQFLKDENVPQDVKDAKLKSLMNFLEVISDPVFQENFIILPRNRQDSST